MPATPGYKSEIEKLAPHHDARHIEAYTRNAHGTLDALSAEEFRREVYLAVACIEFDGRDAAERLAGSYGL